MRRQCVPGSLSACERSLGSWLMATLLPTSLNQNLRAFVGVFFVILRAKLAVQLLSFRNAKWSVVKVHPSITPKYIA